MSGQSLSATIRTHLESSRLRDLFLDVLMWDNSRASATVVADGYRYELRAIATKAGALVLECSPNRDGRIPPTAVRTVIESKVAALYHEHLFVYLNQSRTEQLWRPAPAARDGRSSTSHRCFTGAIGDGIVQVFRQLRFAIADEPTVADVGARIRRAFFDDRFGFYQDYFERLTAAEQDAGLRERAQHRKSAWHYEDSIEYPALDADEAHVLGILLGGDGAAARVVAAERAPIPLDTVFSPANRQTRPERGGVVRADLLPGDATLEPSVTVLHESLHRQCCDLLCSLTPRERRVIELRFGLNDGAGHTLEQIGQEFSVTRERIRQIEDKALGKLRRPSRARLLRDYADLRFENAPVCYSDFPVCAGASPVAHWHVGRWGAIRVAACETPGRNSDYARAPTPESDVPRDRHARRLVPPWADELDAEADFIVPEHGAPISGRQLISAREPA